MRLDTHHARLFVILLEDYMHKRITASPHEVLSLNPDEPSNPTEDWLDDTVQDSVELLTKAGYIEDAE